MFIKVIVLNICLSLHCIGQVICWVESAYQKSKEIVWLNNEGKINRSDLGSKVYFDFDNYNNSGVVLLAPDVVDYFSFSTQKIQRFYESTSFELLDLCTKGQDIFISGANNELFRLKTDILFKLDDLGVKKELTSITDTLNMNKMSISPDGHRIAFEYVLQSEFETDHMRYIGVINLHAGSITFVDSLKSNSEKFFSLSGNNYFRWKDNFALAYQNYFLSKKVSLILTYNLRDQLRKIEYVQGENSITDFLFVSDGLYVVLNRKELYLVDTLNNHENLLYSCGSSNAIMKLVSN